MGVPFRVLAWRSARLEFADAQGNRRQVRGLDAEHARESQPERLPRVLVGAGAHGRHTTPISVRPKALVRLRANACACHTKYIPETTLTSTAVANGAAPTGRETGPSRHIAAISRRHHRPLTNRAAVWVTEELLRKKKRWLFSLLGGPPGGRARSSVTPVQLM